VDCVADPWLDRLSSIRLANAKESPQAAIDAAIKSEERDFRESNDRVGTRISRFSELISLFVLLTENGDRPPMKSHARIGSPG
jgi:hypothetical protein